MSIRSLDKIEIRRARATFEPSTLDRDNRTVEAVVATDSPVPMPGRIERLTLTAEAVRVASRLPLMDTHNQGSVSNILGCADNFRFEGGRLFATLHIRDDRAFDLVADGILTGISIGYRVRKFTDSPRDARSGQLVRTVTSLEIVEVSLVAVPADANAHVRTQKMQDENETGQPETISDQPETVTREQATVIARAANLANPDQFVVDVTTAGFSQQETRSLALQQRRERNAPAATIRVGASGDDPAIQRGFQAEALAATYLGTEPSEGARQYAGTGLQGHMRASLARSGERNVATMSTDTLITRSLGVGMNTTSDFPLVMDDAGHRVLLAAYRDAVTPLKSIGRQVNIPDFRDMTALRVGGLPTLAKVPESGEIKHATIGEAGETFKLDTYASIFAITRQVLMNDNFGVLGDFARNAGSAAANTEREVLLSIVRANAGLGVTMSDGKALFHADHGNLAAAGEAPDVVELSTARLAMRMQTGIDGETRINVAPRFLLVSAVLETVGEQLLASMDASTVGEQNPFAGKLTLLVEPGLPEGSWYLVADPAQVPTLAYGYLSSAPGPQLASRDGWDVLGREWRVVLDFGAGALDWRGAYLNPGEGVL